MPKPTSCEACRGFLSRLRPYVFFCVAQRPGEEEGSAAHAAATALFVNGDDVPYGAVLYGLFRNLYFANVFTVHPSLKHSRGATLTNVRVHDLTHRMREYVRLDKQLTAPYKNVFNAAFDAEALLGAPTLQRIAREGDAAWPDAAYVGDVVVDAQLALDVASANWDRKGLLMAGDDFVAWARAERSWDRDAHPLLGCNNDAMSHVPKGVVGIRVDGVESVRFEGELELKRLRELGARGSDVCGAYWDEDFCRVEGKGPTTCSAPGCTASLPVADAHLV